MPLPKWSCQMRLTMTRAVSGFFGSVSQFASADRRPVEFSPSGGTYTTAQTVTISDSTPGASIFYTTDGTTPATGSTQYSGPITVSTSENVQAIALAPGFSQSTVASATYTLKRLADADQKKFSENDLLEYLESERRGTRA